MKITYLILATLLTVFSNSHQHQAKIILSDEVKEICISAFESYLSVDKEEIDAKLEIVREMYSSSGASESEIESIVNEIVEINKHVNAVLEECIELVKKDNAKPTIELLENELHNIYAHLATNSYKLLDLHSAMSCLYYVTVDTEQEYASKLVDLHEFSRLYIEAIQANQNQIHPKYKYVLLDLVYIYKTLGWDEKRQEVEETLLQLLSEE